MSDANKDRAEGMVEEGTGRAKSAWGELTGDESKQAEGKLDQAKGAAKQAMGDIKDKLDDAKDKLGGDDTKNR